MTDYDIKKGHFANVEGAKLEALAKEVFGNARALPDGAVVFSFGAIEEGRAQAKSPKSLEATTKMKLVEDSLALESIRRWNQFLESATGFNTKERKARLNKKAKDGKL
ncbi:MAG: DUF5611 family protein [Methanobacteriota archaeon]